MMQAMIAALEDAGAFVLKMDRRRDGFDLLAVAPAGTYILRVGPEPLSAYEALVKIGVEAAGSAYYIVGSPDEAVSLVRGDWAAALSIIENGARHELFDCQIHR